MDRKNDLYMQLKKACEQNGVAYQPIDIAKCIFEERIHLKCLYCEKYGNNWRCPPRIPNLDYKKIISEFDNIAIIYNYYTITQTNKDTVRYDSTNHLHKALLSLEKILFDNGNPTALSFIGGSCKLCKNGCDETHCNNPATSRIPVEAIGINVIKTAQAYGIEVKWPVVDTMLRLGMLMW